MASCNLNSIISKAKKRLNDGDMQKKIEKAVDDAVLGNVGNLVITTSGETLRSPLEAAEKFIEVLRNEIMSHGSSSGGAGGLGATAVQALSKLEHGAVTKIGKNRYQIDVWFSEDLSRESLAPSRYEGVENIAALLNSGYSAGHQVYGIWKGHGDEKRASLVERDGAHFIESALRVFMANYADEYNVVDIKVDGAYD